MIIKEKIKIRKNNKQENINIREKLQLRKK
jgi:hypothetical protein